MNQPSEMKQNLSLAVIVPAYNEERGVHRVLTTLLDFPMANEIIFVDDGSTDATSLIAKQYCEKETRINIIQHGKNQGKGQAIFSGYNASSSNYLLTLDADLLGLMPEHLYDLVIPVIQNQFDMTYALFRHGYWRSDLGHILTPWLTGQRCIRRELFWEISRRAAAGYGLETAITVAARRHSWRTKKVYWRGVSHPPSENHRGLVLGVCNRTKMYLHILRAWQIANQDMMLTKYTPYPTKRSS